ncbi:23S rRNA (pseudouridine(1915)-N(3))-methyltransferase RlmH [Simkania sp.]|uniref:23S rRNA (pseudouridine(1915)-N(3))-methyltransferase RlmH n=1 Tax=Simkania sp. TaxID=34094 RepID=UPI003B51EFA2
MIKIKIYTVGKTKKNWLEVALAEYHKRLTGEMTIEWVIAKELQPPKENSYICLDPQGKQYSSPEFASFLEKESIQAGAKLTFVIGGPEGIPEEMRAKASHLISFSKLTFTHQIARLILLEQLYRSVQIQRGTKYHK